MRTFKTRAYTGELAQWEVLGRGLAKWDSEVRWKFFQAVRWVKDNQPTDWDPTDPPTNLASDLHASVADSLGLEPREYGRLKLFNALNSPLDLYFGTDCFLEFEGVVVSVDITCNPDKPKSKADVVAQIDELEDLRKHTSDVHHKIARSIQWKLSDRARRLGRVA